MYDNNDILPFDGSLQGLMDQLDLIRATVPKGHAFVIDSAGNTLNRARVKVTRLTDGLAYMGMSSYFIRN